MNFYQKKSIEDITRTLDAQIQSNKIIHNSDIQCHIALHGVENEFKQVLFILLNNSIDAIRLEIKKGAIKQGVITTTLNCRDNKGIIEVSDNGGGIDSNIIESIFDPYFTTKGNASGTGIGLHIAKNIIESRMKGLLSVENIEGGSCFSMVLPLVG